MTTNTTPFTLNRAAIDAGILVEDSVHRLSAAASELRWAPGRWPREIDTDLGNGCKLLLLRVDEYAAYYGQEFGCIRVTVWND